MSSRRPGIIRASELGGVAFTIRHEGASPPPFDSLNLSLAVGDDPACVAANRAAVSAALGVSARWATARQVHGSAVLVATGATVRRTTRGADAVIAADPEVPVVVLVADCVPIALRLGRAVGAVHAGWRGLAAGVVDAAVSALRRLAGEASAPAAWVGPSVRPCHYEVGPEVGGAFRAAHPDAPGFAVTRDGSTRFDLAGAAAWALERAGARVVGSEPSCTACSRRFFSHRRDGRTGRQALVVWRGAAE